MLTRDQKSYLDKFILSADDKITLFDEDFFNKFHAEFEADPIENQETFVFEIISYLLEHVHENPIVRELEITKRNFSDTQAVLFAQQISNLSTIEKLVFSGITFPDNFSWRIFSEKNIDTLKELYLDGSLINVHLISSMEKAITKGLCLEILSMRGCQLKHRIYIESLVNALIKNQKTCLRYLDLSGWYRDESNNTVGIHSHMPAQDIGYVAQLLERINTLEVLHLDRCNISSQTTTFFSEVLKNNRILKTLSLNNNPLDAEGINRIIDALRGSHNKSLQYLSLNSTCLDHKEEISFDGLFCGNLRYFSYCHNQLNQHGIDQFIKAIENNRTLESLNLENNQIDGKNMQKLLDVLNRTTSIFECDLSHNFISNGVLLGVADILKTNQILRKLNLFVSSSCALNYLEGIPAVMNALQNNHYLTHLSLNMKGVIDDSVIESLKKNSSLVNVNFGKDTFLNDQQKEEIENWLKDNKQSADKGARMAVASFMKQGEERDPSNPNRAHSGLKFFIFPLAGVATKEEMEVGEKMARDIRASVLSFSKL